MLIKCESEIRVVLKVDQRQSRFREEVVVVEVTVYFVVDSWS